MAGFDPVARGLAASAKAKANQAFAVSQGGAAFMEAYSPVFSDPSSTADDSGGNEANAGTWQTLDLSPYIPAGSTAVYLQFMLYMATADVKTHWQFRAVGDLIGGNDNNGARLWWPPQTAAIYYYTMEWLRVSPDGKIQYQRRNAGARTNWWKTVLWGFA